MAGRQKVTITFRVDPSDLDQVTEIAKRAGKKPSVLLRQILSDWLEWKAIGSKAA